MIASLMSKWNLLALAYVMGGLGVFITIAGGSWDITRHAEGEFDTFFTTAHLILYAGVALGALAALGNLYLRFSRSMLPAHLLTGLDFVAFGAATQLVAGPFDFWWHSLFGPDVVLLSPPHAMLIIGIAISCIGTSLGLARLYRHASTTRPETGLLWSPSVLKGLTALSFASMWTSLNGVIYLFTIDDFTRDAITSVITTPAALVLLATTAPIVLLTASRFVKGLGFITLIGAIFMTVSILANLIPRLGQRGYVEFTLFYPVLILPILLADFLLNRTTLNGRRGTLIAGAVLGLPTFLLYFPMTLAYWINSPGGAYGATLILGLPQALFGALGALFSQTLYRFFSDAVPRFPILSSLGMKSGSLQRP